MDLNVKNLEVKSPIDIHNALEKLVRFGDFHATVKGYKNGIEGYYLGGLLISDIKKSSVSSDVIHKFYTGLQMHDINYVLLKSDVRNGKLPLILDDHCRSFLNKNLSDLITSDNLEWRMFFIPIKDEEDGIDIIESDIIYDTEDDENQSYLSLSFSEIEKELKKLKDKDVIEDEETENNITEKEDNIVTSKEYGNLIYDNFFDNQGENNISTDEEGDSFEVESEVDFDGDDAHDDMDDEDINTEVTEDTYEVNHDNNDIHEHELSINEITEPNEFTMVPKELESLLHDFHIGRFTEFENLDNEDTTHVILQKEIKNSNNVLSMIESDIKRKAKQIYFQYMDQSQKTINQAIDVENGEDVVKNRYKDSISKKDELEVELHQNVDLEKQKLEERFWDEHFQTYKEKTLAGLKIQFEKEEYYNLVQTPLESFKETETERIESNKYEETLKLTEWLDIIKDKAMLNDRNNAIIEVQRFLDASMSQAKQEVQNLDSKMADQNERFIKYEFSKKAEENLRNTVDNDLYTDEQAKMYKRQFELTQKKKLDLTNELKELQEKYESDLNSKDKGLNEYKSEIEKNHKKVIDEKNKEVSNLSNTVSELQQKYEKDSQKLKNSKKKNRKNMLITGIGSIAITSVIFGGTLFSVQGHNKETQEELKSQNKIVEQKSAEANDTKSELEKLKKEKDTEKQKQQKIIDKQKKELEKQKDKKKDKK